MVQTLIIALPGLAALIVCMSRGPEQALLDVYLPAMLLLPQQFVWQLSGQLSFADTAILPIGLCLLLRPQREWQWSAIDLLVIGYIAMTAVAEGINNGYELGQNLALQEFFSFFLPYFAVKQTIGRQQFAVACAKRIVVLLVIVAILSVYEFRMGSNLFLWPFAGIFPPEPAINLVWRAGFKRTEGPFGHAMVAGIMMAMGYCIVRWLDWTGEWTDERWHLPISKMRFCRLWIIAGHIMTISIGSWVAAAVSAVALSVCRARNRKRSLALLIFALVVVGPSVYSAYMAYSSLTYTWSANASDSEKLEEDSTYRHKLLEVYIPVIEERPAWGWGRKVPEHMGFPVIDDMWSIDDGYISIALTFGLYALGLLVAILVWTPICLCAFGLKLRHRDPAALAAFSLMGIYVLFAICLYDGSLGTTEGRFIFMVTGWSAALLKADTTEIATAEALAPQPRPQFAFRRMMA
jgi:hypothetical protein